MHGQALIRASVAIIYVEWFTYVGQETSSGRRRRR